MRNPADGRGGDRAVKALPSFLLILLVTAAPTGGQESQGGARLTLQAALDLADKQNLDLAAARQRRFVSRAGVQIAKQRPNPTFSFTALRDSPHEGWFVDQPLELGGKRGHRIEVARQEEKVALSQFNALLNEPAATGWQLAGRLEDPPPAWSVEELVQRAYAANAELQHLAQEEKVEESRRGLLKAERIPNLDLE